MHAARQEQAEVHQVALAPAPVAAELVEQVGRHLFIAAIQIVGDPHRPAGAPHQRGFDEVVRHDRPGQVALARQRRQRAVLHERLEPDDGVVAPEVRFTQLPVVQTGGKQRAIDARGELLDARIERVAPGRARRGLDDARARMRFHQAGQLGEALAGHDAVGIEHHHVAVIGAPATAEVIEVAALALDPATAVPIEDAPEATGLAAQPVPGGGFGGADIGLTTVGEDEEIEVGDLAGAFQRLVGSTQAGKDARHILIADGHDDGRAGLRGDLGMAGLFVRDEVLVIAPHQHQEARHGGPETGRDPQEQQAEQEQHHHLQRLGAVVRQHVAHEVSGHRGLQHHQHQQRDAADVTGVLPVALGIGGIGLVQVILDVARLVIDHRRWLGHLGAALAGATPAAGTALQAAVFLLHPAREGIELAPRTRHHRLAVQRRANGNARLAALLPDGRHHGAGQRRAGGGHRRIHQAQARIDRGLGGHGHIVCIAAGTVGKHAMQVGHRITGADRPCPRRQLLTLLGRQRQA